MRKGNFADRRWTQPSEVNTKQESALNSHIVCHDKLAQQVIGNITGLDRQDAPLFREIQPRRIAIGRLGMRPRSEEHTSELQSLMRISYAVFCLKKKKNTSNNRQKKKNI